MPCRVALLNRYAAYRMRNNLDDCIGLHRNHYSLNGDAKSNHAKKGTVERVAANCSACVLQRICDAYSLQWLDVRELADTTDFRKSCMHILTSGHSCCTISSGICCISFAHGHDARYAVRVPKAHWFGTQCPTASPLQSCPQKQKARAMSNLERLSSCCSCRGSFVVKFDG